LAELNDTCKQKLQRFENDWGVILVAYESDQGVAHLSRQQYSKLEELEKDLGVVLVAYNEPVRSVFDKVTGGWWPRFLAELSSEQLAQLEDFQDEAGMTFIVCVKTHESEKK